jgi:glycosyltransferase involved in cell wall biosynthesis
LVAARDANALADAIDRLWNDGPARARLGPSARQYARSNFSDEAVAQQLTHILDVLTLS